MLAGLATHSGPLPLYRQGRYDIDISEYFLTVSTVTALGNLHRRVLKSVPKVPLRYQTNYAPPTAGFPAVASNAGIGVDSTRIFSIKDATANFFESSFSFARGLCAGRIACE